MTLNMFDNTLPDLNGKVVLVTGGTGSFAQHFVLRVLEKYKPAKLIIYSRDEQKQYEMEQVFSVGKYDCMRYFLGDVRDESRLEMAMRDVDYVIHSAAMKIVPAAEYNPFECINTNIIGAQNIVKAAINAGVEKVINLSTDKAANPINLYGATKLAAEKIFTAANTLSGKGGTTFASVRYGNVIGSRGSIIPLFRRLISEGVEALPITDPRMTRFWITLDQGVNFVLSSLEIAHGGEVFIPKIPSMKVTDLAEAMAPSLPHNVVGIRPGEKIHEVLIPVDDARNIIDYGDRYIIIPQHFEWNHALPDGAAWGTDMEFHYASDNNPEWISGDDLLSLLDSK